VVSNSALVVDVRLTDYIVVFTEQKGSVSADDVVRSLSSSDNVCFILTFFTLLDTETTS